MKLTDLKLGDKAIIYSKNEKRPYSFTGMVQTNSYYSNPKLLFGNDELELANSQGQAYIIAERYNYLWRVKLI